MMFIFTSLKNSKKYKRLFFYYESTIVRGYLFKFICKIQTENERLKKIEIIFSLFVLTICQTFNFGSRAMFFCSLFFKLCSDQIL